MTRRLLVVILTGLIPVGAAGAAQSRPSFTGTWKFVADKSTPADVPALGTEFRISHTTNSLALELPVTESIKQPDGTFKSVAAGLGEPMTYKIDGAEHVMLPLAPDRSVDGRHLLNYIVGGPYRVTWAGSSLVIKSSNITPMTSFREKGQRTEFARMLVSTTFAMNRDGTLNVERSSERDPSDNGEFQIPKRVFKSTYAPK